MITSCVPDFAPSHFAGGSASESFPADPVPLKVRVFVLLGVEFFSSRPFFHLRYFSPISMPTRKARIQTKKLKVPDISVPSCCLLKEQFITDWDRVQKNQKGGRSTQASDGLPLFTVNTDRESPASAGGRFVINLVQRREWIPHCVI